LGPRSSARGGRVEDTVESRASPGRSRLVAADVVLLVDHHGRIREATGAAREMFGRSGDGLRDESFSGPLCLPAARASLGENLGRAARGGPHLFSAQIVRGDGVVVPVEVSSQAAYDETEGLLVCIVRDITGRALSFPVERLQLENEIRKLQLRLVQSQKLEAATYPPSVTSWTARYVYLTLPPSSG